MGRQPWTKIGLYCGTGVAFMALGHLVPKESEFIFALWCSALIFIDVYHLSVLAKLEGSKSESDQTRSSVGAKEALLARIWRWFVLLDSLAFVCWLLLLLRPKLPNQSWDPLYIVLMVLFSVATYVGFNNRRKTNILK